MGIFGGIFRPPKFIRRYIRRRTRHIPEARAENIKKNISIAYAVVSWNVLGFFIYGFFKRLKNRDPLDTTPKKRWWEGNVINLGGTEKHYRIHGFHVEEVKKEENREETEL